MRIDFYHLTRTPVELALPSIAERIMAAGQRLLIVAEDAALRDRIDTALWTWKADSFVPHGQNGDQPVLIHAEMEAGGYDMMALADGVWRDLPTGIQRCFHFFDAESIDDARTAWRSLTDRPEFERHYWKQNEGGGWVEGP